MTAPPPRHTKSTANSLVQETATVPVTVAYVPGLAATGTATVMVSLAPISDNPNASSTDPIPRFIQTELPQTLFTIGACASAPGLAWSNPNNGPAGSAVPVILRGANFAYGATVNVSNPQITVSDVKVVSDTKITATFTIASDATPGTAQVSVTTAAGTGDAVKFTISPSAPAASK